MANHKFTIFVKNLDGDIWEVLAKDFSISDELNHESKASVKLSYQEFTKIAVATDTTLLTIFTASFREIWIERNGTKIFWGAITSFEVDPSEQGEMTIKLNCVSWFGLFQKRITEVPKRVFSSTDAGDIAWTLIDESQNTDSPYSELGITEGSITASKDRDRTYRFDNVKDSIIKLSNDNLADGFDFEIDNTKAFNVYYPTKGTNRFNIVFDFRTMSGFKYKLPLLFDLVNRVHVIGSGENDDVLYATRNGTNGNKTSWKLLEEKLSERDIEELVTLQDKGDKRLDEAESPIIEFEAQHYDSDIQWSDYALGDSVKVNLPELGLSNATKRVYEREMLMETDKSIARIKTTLR